ncbi:EamA family transporter RarD [Sphingomicrobium sp. XHP0239]|uniref:EamA family transporter RarD n=1 Tax=Sphingomicrobium maritimum TaxID=3133972 RepID=UPI0031CC735B
MATPQSRSRSGYVYALSAFALWGVIPLFFKAMIPMDSMDIVSWRVVLGVPTLAIFLFVLRKWDEVRVALLNRRVLWTLLASAVLIAINWVVYVYGVNSNRVLATSLGYYLNPLLNILLGRFILKEALGPFRWAALAVAGVGVAVLAFGALQDLWITLSLALSFGVYGLLRKTVDVGAAPGLFLETLLLAPLFALWLLAFRDMGDPLWGPEPYHFWLILASGAVTCVPLLLFTEGARRLPYSTIGILQFSAPTVQFFLGVLLFDEAFTPNRMMAFAAIWSAVILYTISLIRESRREKRVTLVEQSG